MTQRTRVTRDEYMASHLAAYVTAAKVLGFSFSDVTLDQAAFGLNDALRPVNRSMAVVWLAGLGSSEILLGDDLFAVPPHDLLSAHSSAIAISIIKTLVDGDDAGEELFHVLLDEAEALLLHHRCLWRRLTGALVTHRTVTEHDARGIAAEACAECSPAAN
jgi:hypothetical protein